MWLVNSLFTLSFFLENQLHRLHETTNMYEKLIAMAATQTIGAILYQPSVIGQSYYQALKLKPRQVSALEWIMVTAFAWIEVNAIDYIISLTNPTSLNAAFSNIFYVYWLFVVPTQAVHFPFDQRSYYVLFVYLLHHGLTFAANTAIIYSFK